MKKENKTMNKCKIPDAETSRKLTYFYHQELLEEIVNTCRNKTVKAISDACNCGRFGTEIEINSDDPITIKAWTQIGAELATLNYQHTYNWEANRKPAYLISITIRWDGGDW